MSHKKGILLIAAIPMLLGLFWGFVFIASPVVAITGPMRMGVALFGLLFLILSLSGLLTSAQSKHELL